MENGVCFCAREIVAARTSLFSWSSVLHMSLIIEYVVAKMKCFLSCLFVAWFLFGPIGSAGPNGWSHLVGGHRNTGANFQCAKRKRIDYRLGNVPMATFIFDHVSMRPFSVIMAAS